MAYGTAGGAPGHRAVPDPRPADAAQSLAFCVRQARATTLATSCRWTIRALPSQRKTRMADHIERPLPVLQDIDADVRLSACTSFVQKMLTLLDENVAPDRDRLSASMSKVGPCSFQDPPYSPATAFDAPVRLRLAADPQDPEIDPCRRRCCAGETLTWRAGVKELELRPTSINNVVELIELCAERVTALEVVSHRRGGGRPVGHPPVVVGRHLGARRRFGSMAGRQTPLTTSPGRRAAGIGARSRLPTPKACPDCTR